ncbi:MAG TPA: glycosyltransferase family 2 protein [Solirubrobacterales bacterium]|nr:glycosyltransferase family 2 protein [Solirubrobacterales bacterium]
MGGAGGRPKIVLLGMMTPMPVAGVVWQNLHYLLGFERLGFEVYYVETHARTPSMLMSDRRDDSSALAAEFIASVMRRFGLADRWAFRALHDDRRCYGMSELRLERLYGEAELLINLHGGTQPLPELASTGRLVYLETDPVQMQLELAHGLPETLDFLEPHAAFFSFAENWGNPDCRLPASERFRFHPTRQPVVLDLWPDRSPQPADLYTTVGNWRQDWREVSFEGERYTWSKHHEFLKYLDLPRRTGLGFELALSSCTAEDREMLAERGWGVRDGLAVSTGIDRYRDFIGASRGEFTVAKDQNVRLRTGWFSDRGVTYLASGRPVVNQDTGFGSVLPTGEGLFSFDSPDSAAEALVAIEADYSRHAAAAREIAREHFDHEVVLGRMLEDLGVSARTGSRQARRAGLFPAEMEMEPVSRRPMQLARGTVEAAQAMPVSIHSEAPPLGPGSASIVVLTHNGLAFTRLCLESVLAHTAEHDFELIVVDNASDDGTRTYLAKLADADARVRVLFNARNMGFAPACNQGLGLALGEHLVLLNNDTMVPPGWLAPLLAHLRDPAVGLVGPVTNRIGNEAEIETDYRTWGEFLDFARRQSSECSGQWLAMRTPAMFCLALRRQTFHHLGPLDERYEVGLLEDDDYAERARQAGYELRCVEDCFVHHFGEASFGNLVADGEYLRILRANQQRYAEKWGRPWEPYGRRANPRYEREAAQLREAVAAAVPTGAEVLVISRGDDSLLELNGCRASHFPQGRDGGWAGHHPADSEEAIDHLEALRAGGARYLVVPPTYRWWLEHYAGLREHLDSRYRPVVVDERAGAIYELEDGGG